MNYLLSLTGIYKPTTTSTPTLPPKEKLDLEQYNKTRQIFLHNMNQYTKDFQKREQECKQGFHEDVQQIIAKYKTVPANGIPANHKQ